MTDDKRSDAQRGAERRYEGKRRGQPRVSLRLTDDELAHLQAVAWPGESRVATVRRALMTLTPRRA